MPHELGDNPSLSDYALSEDESLEEYAEFSPKYQAFRLFRACLSLQAQQQYPRARKTFYDNLGWFTVMFDPVFPRRSQAIIERYSTKYYQDTYTFEQIEQLKYMRIVMEFSRMLIDASSRNRIRFNVNPNKRVELTPVGYAQILNYEHMSVEFFNKLTQIQQQQSHRDAVKFFNHAIAWFGGIFDAKFMVQGYLIDQTETNSEFRFRKLVSAFSKLLTRKSITPTAFATLVYKPRPGDNTPRTVSDIVKAKESKSAKTEKPTDISRNIAAQQEIQAAAPQQEISHSGVMQQDILSSTAAQPDILHSVISDNQQQLSALQQIDEGIKRLNLEPAGSVHPLAKNQVEKKNPIDKKEIALTVDDIWEQTERKMKERAAEKKDLN